MSEVGRARELWRYPVKSMQGQPVEVLDVTGAGVDGDRAWGVVDSSTGKLLSAKTVPELLHAWAAPAPGGGVVVTLPDGEELHGAPSPEVDKALSVWLDREVSLRRASATDEQLSYQMTFDPPNDEAELVEIPARPDSFADLAPLHLLTDRSLDACRAERPGTEWDRRRFRPNVLVAADGEGYVEDGWVGRSLDVGGAGVDVLMRTVRCALPLRAQPAREGDPALARDVDPALARDVEVFRTLTRIHDNHLGVYATVARPGRIALGDAVRLR